MIKELSAEITAELKNDDAETTKSQEYSEMILMLLEENERLRKENKDLIAENHTLSINDKDQNIILSGGSKVSSIPPSHDFSSTSHSFEDLKKMINKERGIVDKDEDSLKRGKQRGAIGHGRKLEDVDEKNIIKCKPTQCLNCANKDNCNTELHRYSTRHVDDIKIIKIRTTYELYNCKCPLHNNETILPNEPTGITSTMQFGYTIQILVILLYYFGLSYEKIYNFFNSVVGKFSPSTGTIHNIVKRFGDSDSLNQSYNNIFDILNNKHGVLHADETGIRGNKINFWLHVICDKLFSFCFISKFRGFRAMVEGGTASLAEGNILMHDCWASYFKIDQVVHALCNAHIIRDLAGIWLYHKQKWAFELIVLLLEILDAKKYAMESGLKKFSQEVIDGFKEKILELVKIGIEENPISEDQKGKKRSKKSKPLRIAKRIEDKVDDFLAFVKNFDIPFTNNIAERAIRSAKIKIKNAGYLEEDGARIYAKIFSVLSTVNKNQMSMFESIKDMLSNNVISFCYYF